MVVAGVVVALASLGRWVDLQAAQQRVVLVRVREATTNVPIANADVANAITGVHRLSDERGEARIPMTDTVGILVRVRQIGFTPVERRVLHRASGADTLDVTMSRNSVTLPATVARAPSSCAAPGDSATRELSLLALDQLRLAAEHYEEFTRAYPFRVYTHTRSVPVPRDGKRMKTQDSETKVDADAWGDPYEPGQVLHPGFHTFSVSILFVATLADSAFWNRHCLVARRVETLQGHRVLPLEFTPAPWHREADWAGTAWLDSATSALRRVDFRLTGLEEHAQPRRLEGYMTFSSPSPYIALPDSIVAGWWKQDPTDSGDWGLPNVVQLVHVTKVEYLKRAPPDSAKR